MRHTNGWNNPPLRWPLAEEVLPEQAVALLAQDPATLAAWWCELNRWRWPEGLPNPEEGWIQRRGSDDSRAWAIMAWIYLMVGERLIARTWNSDMPDDVFESFWRQERDLVGSPYYRWIETFIDRRAAVARAREDAILGADEIGDALDASEIN